MSRRTNILKKVKQLKRQKKQMREAAARVAAGGVGDEEIAMFRALDPIHAHSETKTGERSKDMNAKLAVDVDIDGVEARLAAHGREALLWLLEKGEFSFPLFKRLVFVRIANTWDIRRVCGELTERQMAEYIVFVVLQLTASLSARHEKGFFEEPGLSRYSVLLDVKSFTEAHDVIEEVRCSQKVEMNGGEPC